MKEKKTLKKVNSKNKINTSKKISKKGKTGKKKNIKIITVVDYVFLISLALSVIFGIQTNGVFLLPFTITLVITIVCMCIILINAIYSRIKKKFRKGDKSNENSINK